MSGNSSMSPVLSACKCTPERNEHEPSCAEPFSRCAGELATAPDPSAGGQLRSAVAGVPHTGSFQRLRRHMTPDRGNNSGRVGPHSVPGPCAMLVCSLVLCSLVQGPQHSEVMHTKHWLSAYTDVSARCTAVT